MMEAVLHTILLELHKAYGALDWDMCLDILAVYGVGPRILHTLWTYWDRLQMVAKDGG